MRKQNKKRGARPETERAREQLAPSALVGGPGMPAAPRDLGWKMVALACPGGAVGKGAYLGGHGDENEERRMKKKGGARVSNR